MEVFCSESVLPVRDQTWNKDTVKISTNSAYFEIHGLVAEFWRASFCFVFCKNITYLHYKKLLRRKILVTCKIGIGWTSYCSNFIEMFTRRHNLLQAMHSCHLLQGTLIYSIIGEFLFEIMILLHYLSVLLAHLKGTYQLYACTL